MKYESIETLTEDRAISPKEADIVTWLLLRASKAESLVHLQPIVKALRVEARCSCGCGSVDFQHDGQTLPFQPIAEASGRTAEGTFVEVILWGRNDSITGLELVFYETDESVRSLPLVETLQAE